MNGVEIVEDLMPARMFVRACTWRLRACLDGVDVGIAVPAPGSGDGWWVLACPAPLRMPGPAVEVEDRRAAEEMLRGMS